MSSLRLRLFAILVLATGLLWVSAVVWIDIGTRREVEHVLDTRLQEAARMVDSLVGSADGGRGAVATVDPLLGGPPPKEGYTRQLSCQIWSLDGRLVARSESAPSGTLGAEGSGFAERTVDGERWRVYAVDDAAKGVRVLVGDRLGLREKLVRDLLKGLLAPAALIMPLLAALIWASLGSGLRPLRAMAREVEERGADDMSPIDPGHAPREIRPLAAALNALLRRLEAARQHERSVTAFAAHELRTPLAGLKTQAQVALGTVDGAVRERALRQILASVDRSTRLIRQLLAMSRLDSMLDEERRDLVNLGDVLGDVIDPAADAAQGVETRLDPGLGALSCHADRDSLALALRNLHENALQHMQGGGAVCWSGRRESGGRVFITVEDEGPGIPEDELDRVRERFFRGRHRSQTGTGLGLSIVDLALKRSGGRLHLANRWERSGLRAEVDLPA
jgi:two-component system sensor histidine kinase QseC